MATVAFVALVVKDLRLFFSDRRAVLVSFVVPIAIASFFGSIFPGPGRSDEPARISLTLADADGSEVSRAIVAAARGDRALAVDTADAAEARARVRRGSGGVAVVIPPGFGDASVRALRGGGDPPVLEVRFDPSRPADVAVVRGLLTEHVLRAVGRALPGGGSPGLALPYTVRAEPVTAGTRPYNGYAHSFAGMGIQFLLFATANLGVEMLLERRRGLWKRLRSAPVSRHLLLAAKVASGTLIALLTLLVSFAFAMVVFGVRIEGSGLGFLAVSVACAVMAATFGLLVAALGRTPATARGVTTLAVLLMVMLGGAWVPTFVFPAWLARLTVIVPARWAVDGLDAMTWRGLGLASAVTPTLVLLAFAAVFAAVALARFRWEES